MKKTSQRKLFLFLILLFVVFFTASITAQTRNEEELLENQAETSDETELLELLESLRQHPIKLNSATEKELAEIPFILPNFAKIIVDYREAHGHFSVLTQLGEISNLPADLAETIRPYVTLEEAKRKYAFPIRIYSRTRFKRKIEKDETYIDGTFFDSPAKFYQRFRVEASENIQLGILLEKDSGEENYRDYQSLFLNLNKLPFNSQIILGDFSIKSGQGLVFWGPYGGGLSANPVAGSGRQFPALKPFQSVDENAALRGIAWQTGREKFTSQIFFSRRNIDATLDETEQVINRYTTGLHRNDTELAKKNRVEEQVTGTSVSWEPLDNLNIGGTFANYRYSHSFICSDSLRRRFTFTGTENQLGSLSFNYVHSQLGLFGEIAQSRNRKRALTAGGTLNFGELVMTLLYRYYDPAFQSHHGRAFGQFAESPQNETGFFSAIKYRFSRKTILQSYFDFSRQLWRSYLIPMPRESKSYYLQLLHRISRNLSVTTQWRIRETEENMEADTEYGHKNKYLIPKLSQNLRLQLDVKLSAYFLLRNRIEKKWTKFYHTAVWQNTALPENHGWIIYQQLNFKPRDVWTIYTRLCFFDISDYDSRIYVFENDLPGTLTNRMLMNRGSRWFGMVIYDWSPRIKLAFKFGSDYIDNLSNQQSEPVENPGTKNNEFAFLVDWIF